MVQLKRTRRLAFLLAERFDVPPEAVPNAVRLSVTEGKQALIENHCGILELGETCIVVASAGGQIRVLGMELSLRAMNRRELLIEGSIQQVEWE